LDYSEADFEKLGIDAQLRAENLGVAEFAKVANYLVSHTL
jgi:16S rRNA A1518/A1519 N6-dimethyltransferase RsmA/KsgA/DIM1 with predicted DNA glycosylase/AP lyase activity